MLARIILVLTLTLAIGQLYLEQPAFSQNRYSLGAFYNCTRDTALLKAFDALVDSPGEQSLERIVHQPARVILKDLATVSKKIRNYDALSWLTPSGLVIYVSSKHADAPPEALAAIIAHEALHHDAYNSLSEEVAGWTMEAEVWQEMLRRNPALSQIPKGTYPLVDRLNEISRQHRQGTLADFVRANKGYQGLAENSPGFPVNAPNQALSSGQIRAEEPRP